MPFYITITNRKKFLRFVCITSIVVCYLGPICNLIYAGLRAQNSPNSIGRLMAFMGGFPFSLLTYFVVGQGSNLCYGVHLPHPLLKQ